MPVKRDVQWAVDKTKTGETRVPVQMIWSSGVLDVKPTTNGYTVEMLRIADLESAEIPDNRWARHSTVVTSIQIFTIHATMSETNIVLKVHYRHIYCNNNNIIVAKYGLRRKFGSRFAGQHAECTLNTNNRSSDNRCVQFVYIVRQYLFSCNVTKCSKKKSSVMKFCSMNFEKYVCSYCFPV